MDRLTRALKAVPLPAIVAFVTQWTDILHVSPLVHPDWDREAGQIARPFSIALMLLLFFALEKRRKPAVRKWALAFLGLWLALMALCLAFNAALSVVGGPATAELIIGIWHAAYETATASAVVAALAVGLWATASA
ncbi:MAG: hypothetical protein U1F33_08175 [Alphaproteobacteria bacterium]